MKTVQEVEKELNNINEQLTDAELPVLARLVLKERTRQLVVLLWLMGGNPKSLTYSAEELKLIKELEENKHDVLPETQEQ